MSRNSRLGPTEQNAGYLKGRVKDLEAEVATLKSRLDELRKAKNNTVFKREREVIHVGEPTLGRPVGVETAKYKELEKKLGEVKANLEAARKDVEEAKKEIAEAEAARKVAEQERDEWKEKDAKLAAVMRSVKASHELEIGNCKAEIHEKSAQLEDLTTELERLRERLEMKSMQEEHKKRENTDREGHIAALTNDNAYLREKVETLYMELSIKEAQWTEKEEKFKIDLKKEWGERYGAWMAATEKKLAELQEANSMLRRHMNGERKRMDGSEGFTEEERSKKEEKEGSYERRRTEEDEKGDGGSTSKT